MFKRSGTSKSYKLEMASGSTFGRDAKISQSRSFNFFLSDGFLVPYSGYQTVVNGSGGKLVFPGTGRGIFTSNAFNFMVVVIYNQVYQVEAVYVPHGTPNYYFNYTVVGTLDTYVGDVYITENNNGMILISDSVNLYVFQPNGAPTFQIVTLDFIPGYITFHDQYFIAASQGTPNWRLSNSQNFTFPTIGNARYVGTIQRKADNCVGVVAMPSHGNMVMVFGENVGEPFFDQGLQQFPYGNTTSFNIDYGVVSASTLAYTDDKVVWLAKNEKSGPIILASDGGPPEKISTDGIDYLFANLTAPEDSDAFIFRQDGHLFYHINFYTDNISLFYDFNTKLFFNASDESGNTFLLHDIAFYNNQYYGVSRQNGHIYAFDTIYDTYDGAEIPRIRICPPVRDENQDYFIITDVGFTTQQGDTNPQMVDIGPFILITNDDYGLITNDNYFIALQPDAVIPVYPRIDLTLSIDGGETFGSSVPYYTNPIGRRVNKALWWQLGLANDVVFQFRFWGFGRVLCTDGVVNVRY